MRPLPLLLAVLALPLPAAARPAQAPCPAERHGLVDGLARAAPSCRAAADLVMACSVGSGADVLRASETRERCEAQARPRLDAAGRRALDRAVARCRGRYRHEEGSMYRSLEALCALDEAARRVPRRGRPDDFGWVPAAAAALPPDEP